LKIARESEIDRERVCEHRECCCFLKKRKTTKESYKYEFAR